MFMVPGIGADAQDRCPHCFVPCATKTVSQNQPLETAASKPVESPKSVSGDSLPTREIARNRAISRVSQESKFEPGLVGWGPGFEPRFTESESAILPSRADGS